MKFKTTRKDVMKKSLAGKSEKEVFDLCAKYFNELAQGYCFEHEIVQATPEGNYCENENFENVYKTVSDFCGEICYWLSCYYELGNCRHDDEYNDRRAFLKFLEVFKPYTNGVSLKWVGSVPTKPETKFLFEN